MSFSEGEELALRYKKTSYVYREDELKEFEKELEKYKTTKKQSDGITRISYDLKKFLVDNRALTEDGAVLVTGFKKIFPKGKSRDDYFYDCDTPNYEIYMDKFDQFLKFLGRKEYGKKKMLEDLDSVAKTSNAQERCPVCKGPLSGKEDHQKCLKDFVAEDY